MNDVKRRKKKPDPEYEGMPELGEDQQTGFRTPNKKGKIQWGKTVQVIEPDNSGDEGPRGPWSSVF